MEKVELNPDQVSQSKRFTIYVTGARGTGFLADNGSISDTPVYHTERAKNNLLVYSIIQQFQEVVINPINAAA